MRNVWYLAVMVGLSVLGVLIIWLRSRPSSSPRSSVEQFNDKMKALSPDQDLPADERRRRRISSETTETS